MSTWATLMRYLPNVFFIIRFGSFTPSQSLWACKHGRFHCRPSRPCSHKSPFFSSSKTHGITSVSKAYPFLLVHMAHPRRCRYSASSPTLWPSLSQHPQAAPQVQRSFRSRSRICPPSRDPHSWHGHCWRPAPVLLPDPKPPHYHGVLLGYSPAAPSCRRSLWIWCVFILRDVLGLRLTLDLQTSPGPYGRFCLSGREPNTMISTIWHSQTYVTGSPLYVLGSYYLCV